MNLGTRRRGTHRAAAADGSGQAVYALTSLHQQLLEAAPDAAIRDAAAQIQTNRALRVSDELWRMSLDGMLEGFAIYRCVRDARTIVDFEVSYINPAGAQTFGRSVSELIGVRMRTLIPQVVDVGRFAELVDVVETGQSDEKLQHGYVDGIVEGIFDSRTWKLGDGIAVTWRDITEREHALARLRTSEERFRASVQYLHDSLSVFTAVRDESGAIVDFRWDYANDVSSAITRYSAAELEGRSLLEVLPDHGPSGMLEVYANVVETGEPWVQPDLWYEDVWGDGQRRRKCFDIRATKLRDGFVVVTRDVTAQREEAQAFEAARFMLEASLDSLVAISPEGRITDANQATVKVTGFSRDDLIGTAFSDYFTEPDKANEIYQRVFAEGMAVDYPLSMRHQDGSVTDVLYNASAYRDAQGNVLGVFAAARDVTDRNKADRELHRMASIIEYSGDAIISKTLDGVITSWNPAAERMYGFSSNEAIGKSISLIVQNNRLDELATILAKIRSDQTISQLDTVRVRKDGTVLPVELTVSPIHDATGAIVGASTITRDMTKQIRRSSRSPTSKTWNSSGWRSSS